MKFGAGFYVQDNVDYDIVFDLVDFLEKKLSDRSYGFDVEEFCAGIKVLDERGKFFIKVKKPRYVKERVSKVFDIVIEYKKIILFDIILDAEKVKFYTENERLIYLKEEFILSISSILVLEKKKLDFDFKEFINDFKLFVNEFSASSASPRCVEK